MSGATAGSTVELRHVTKHYDRRAIKEGAPGAVNDLSLTVPAGKVCVFVGPSGCGKTTTLKMVNRLIEPTSGEILLDDVRTTSQPPTRLRRGIGYVIQNVGLFPHQTIGDNVGTVPRLLGWPRARRRERAEELLRLVGLEPGVYHDRYPSQLSGGERQRVGVARALAADPPILLMDEPFGAVDPIVRERLQNELLRLQQDLRKTILFVTHDIDEAIKMGDLVAVMEQGGRLAQFGPPAEILAHPASEFVARFVGVDRGLKRLSLVRVGELDLTIPPTARSGENSREATKLADDAGAGYLLLVDDDGRPGGWVDRRRIDEAPTVLASMATTTSPLLSRQTTLKDALSMLLEAGVETAIVVDDDDKMLGQVTIGDITARLRDGAGGPTDPSQTRPGSEAEA